MSEETKEYNDQADELRKLFNEVQEESEPSIPEEDIKKDNHEKKVERDVDILNLPPRGEVHSINKKRTRLKVSGASLRFIFVIITLLVLVGGAYYLWGQELIEVITNI